MSIYDSYKGRKESEKSKMKVKELFHHTPRRYSVLSIQYFIRGMQKGDKGLYL